MLKIILISLVLLNSSLLAHAAEKVGVSKLPNNLEVHEYKLKNGLQILIVPDHSAPVFTFQAWYRVGSADEKLDPKLQRTGLAHFFEHMMFRGSKNYPGDYFSIISPMGSNDENATTSYDRTNYFESLPKERLDSILKLEADRAVNLVVNEKIFDTERGAVLGEYKMGRDRPGTIAYDELSSLAFEKSPYRATIIGTEEEIKGFTVAEAQYFYRTYYAPNNATVILLGDLDPDTAVTHVEKFYGKMIPQEIPQNAAEIDPEQTKARRKQVTHPLSKNDLLTIGFVVPSVSDKDYPVLEAAAAILSSGDSSFLEQDLVAKGYASRVSAGNSGRRLANLFTIQAEVIPGKSVAEVEKIIRTNIDRLATGKISEPEFKRGVNQYLMQNYTELRNLTEVGTYIGESLRSGNFLRSFEILEEIKKVTVNDVARVAGNYLAANRVNTVIVSPEKK
jgi:zinc protease